MGDNDFTAGDPWGLPIEDSEEIELDSARPEADAQEPGGDFETSPDEDVEPDAPFVTEAPAEPPSGDILDEAPDTLVDPEEDEVGTEGWMSAPDEPQTFGEEPTAQNDLEDVAPESSNDESDDYTFKAPSRTPLSQMIAAAQSVVSSVQGDGDEERSESEETDPVDDQPPAFDGATTPEETPADFGEPIAMTSALTGDQTAGEEDLPEEPPSWMIVDQEPDRGLLIGSIGDTEASEDGDTEDTSRAFTPSEIEASIADLATPETPEAPFAEDHFEMAGQEPSVMEDDRAVASVDMDSSPGVYSELHDLTGNDEQAEALLKEAAEAFGRTPELTEEPSTEDLDSYADALATDLQTPETTIEPDGEDLELTQEPSTEDLDSYADALATDLQTPETTIEPDGEDLELTQEPSTEDLDSYADALATDLQTPETTIEPDGEDLESLDGDQAIFVESDSADYVGEDELGAALAGLTEASPDDLETSTDETIEPPTPSWWSADTQTLPDDDLTEASPDDLDTSTDETIEPPTPSWWSADTQALPDDDLGTEETTELPPADDGDESDELVATVGAVAAIGSIGMTDGSSEPVDLEVDGEDHVTPEPSAVIDSPVEWGVRYREAHQGWVEDDEGRSTWRPIVTSGESVAGWDIDIYLGLVSGDISIDPASTEALASEVSVAREGAVRRMLDEGLARGAHAVVGVTFTIEDAAGVILVGASGVAVTLRTPA